jgi:UDP-N-acetylmuramoyl-L-alanyl-D-glutamate--2,6-diaminopimelate ligase
MFKIQKLKTDVCFKSYVDKAQILENQLSGLLLKINEMKWVKLIGTFNAYNLLAIYGTAVELEWKILRLLSEFRKCFRSFSIYCFNSNITALLIMHIHQML